MEKAYNPSIFEEEIYNLWYANNLFKINLKLPKKFYKIVMPPPNITGALHMGHALDFSLQDVLARYKRMLGFEIIWIPGTDHAAIATEAKVVEKLRKENLSKESLGYSKFMEECWKWKEKYGGKIVSQIKKLGASCDWSKERFTMDEGCSEAVNEFFVSLYEKGLIYRGDRIVNWCPYCNTSISDIEVEFKESNSELFYLKYFIDGQNKFLTVATTRPETIFGDVAVAVNPNDERYKNLVGKDVIIPLVGRKIKIIEDDYVDMSFGTGALKITPAHDFADFEIGEKHNLEKLSVINQDGKLNEQCLEYSGLNSLEARKLIVKDLISKDLVVKRENIKNNVGKCSRCDHTIEPLISTQWFMKMEKLSAPAIREVENGHIKFTPKRFSKIYMHWMKNVKDWCISRQLWWGHQIPAWYCNDCGHINVSKSDLKECAKCKSSNITRDRDSLDTWFSAALWPFSTFDWPNLKSDLFNIYPNNVVITGYDIIFFWVARMIFSSLEMTGKIPFEDVVIHGLVRDSQGRKMSKSLGNGIDPLEIISNYGTDALRVSLVMGLTPGNDVRFSKEKIEGTRNFINKIWNAARFLKSTGAKFKNSLDINTLSKFDSWMLSRLNETIKEVKSNMEKFEFGISLQKIYSLFWDEFCDWYIEFCKIIYKDEKKFENCCFIFCQILKLLHPFAPFVTEKVWSFFNDSYLAISEYPEYSSEFEYKKDASQIQRLIEFIHSVRSKRNEMNTPHNKKIKVYVSSENDDLFKENLEIIKSMASVSELEINKDFSSKNTVLCVLDFCKIVIPMDELADKNEILKKLKADIELLEKKIEKSKSLLSDSSFVEKAPKDVVEKSRKTLENDQKRYEDILKKLNDIQN